MTTIKLINNLHFDDRLLCNGPTGKASELFIRQGDLDRACAVYSLMMMLIINKKIKRNDLERKDQKPGRTSLQRLQKQFLYDIVGIYRGGYFFDTLAGELKSSFASKAKAVSYNSFDNQREDFISKSDLHSTIRETLDSGFPVEIGFTCDNRVDGHAVVAIGYTIYKNRMQLFCLDPAEECPKTSFWNSIVDIELDNKTRKRFTDSYHTINGDTHLISVDEILTIE